MDSDSRVWVSDRELVYTGPPSACGRTARRSPESCSASTSSSGWTGALVTSACAGDLCATTGTPLSGDPGVRWVMIYLQPVSTGTCLRAEQMSSLDQCRGKCRCW